MLSGQERYFHRDVMMHSYILETDSAGHRLGHINLSELRNRVVITEEAFEIVLRELEVEGFFSHEVHGIIADEHFEEIQGLVEDVYNPDCVPTEKGTTRSILNMLYSSANTRNAATIARLTSTAVEASLGIKPTVVQDGIFLTPCEEYEWVFWFEVVTRPQQVKSSRHITNALDTLLDSREKGQYPGCSLFYLLGGPSFDDQTMKTAAKHKSIAVMWALGVIKFIREMKLLGITYKSPEDIQMHFPHFFDEQTNEEGKPISVFSTTRGFENLKNYLGGGDAQE